jgi:predicted RecB family nuclease
MATMQPRTLESGPILIGGGELGRCPTRVHHRRFTTDDRDPNPVAERRIAEGRRWEATVVARLLDGSGMTTVTTRFDAFDRNAPVTIGRSVRSTEREEVTRELLSAEVPLIIGGRMSSSELQSVGAPDLLVRLEDGYAPIDVKHHKVIGRSGIPARFTSIDRLTHTEGTQRPFRAGRVTDLLQVSHYWRLLDEMGVANERHLVGVIGAERPMSCLWVDVSRGSPSMLDRYRTAFDEALSVIQAGRERPDVPLVPAVWRGECRGCPWATICRSELEAIDHVSLLPAVRSNDTRRLLAAGIETTAGVARMTLDEAPEDMEDPAEAILQARARAAGALLPRAGADVALPNARTTIDFDVETFRGDLYLAGLLVTDDGTSDYRPIADWTGTAEGEARIVADLLAFFDDLADRGDFVVYHWTGYERTILDEASKRHGLTLRSAGSVDDWFDRYACDLWEWVKKRFVSPNGYSLKVVAPLCGFDWRDGDPGGAQSEMWYSDLLAGDLTQRVRLLEYNEDDVAAQLAIRRWVRRAT